MKAAVLHAPGGPDALKLEQRPVPQPTPGQVLIRVEAFGLNRSETVHPRQGLSPSVKFPRVLGIEAVGTVAAAPRRGVCRKARWSPPSWAAWGGSLTAGMPNTRWCRAAQVKALRTTPAVGDPGCPARNAANSVGCAVPLASAGRWRAPAHPRRHHLGSAWPRPQSPSAMVPTVAATSRNPGSETLLRQCGADLVFIDDGAIAERVRRDWQGGADKVLELVGTATLQDSLRCTAEPGLGVLGWHGRQRVVDGGGSARWRRSPTAVAPHHLWRRREGLHGDADAGADR